MKPGGMAKPCDTALKDFVNQFVSVVLFIIRKKQKLRTGQVDLHNRDKAPFKQRSR